MSPESGLTIALAGSLMIVLIWVAGVRSIRKVFQEADQSFQNASDKVGMTISLFVFKVVMLLLLLFVLWFGLLVASMRS